MIDLMRTPRRIGWLAAAALASLTALTLTAGTVVAAPSPVAPAASPVVAAPDGAERGTWSVQSLGSGRYVVSWTSPTRFPITSDRPTIVGSSGDSFGVSTIDADGRTVRATATSSTRPDPADLDVMLSGDRLDTTGNDQFRARRGAKRSSPLDLPDTETLTEDPGTPGPYDVVTSNYRLDPVKLPRMAEPIEMVGRVVEPSAGSSTGPRPLVVFVHGRHSVCYKPGRPNAGSDEWPCRRPFKEIPSHLGYDYIQRVLASQGYATVSVRVNGINAQDYNLADGGADARAKIIRRHLDHWVDIAGESQVDLDKVVLVGHSRGGEGVDRASIQIPLGAPYRVAGQVLIAPTDFGTQTAPYVPTVTMLPSCDGDVSDLQGQRFTDTARGLSKNDSSLKSSVLVMGANHNYFNTEWTPGVAVAPSFDDWYGDEDATCGENNPQRLSPQAQRDVGTAYVAGAVRLFADDEQAMLPLFDGSRARVESQGDAQTLSHAIGGGRDLRLPGVTAGLSMSDGARTRFCDGKSDPARVASCAFAMKNDRVHPNWPDGYERVPTRPFFQMAWTESGQSGGMTLDTPLDLSDRHLMLRTIVEPKKAKGVNLRVRLTDTSGNRATVTPVGGGTLPAIGDTRYTKNLWTQTLTVEASGASGVDLSQVKRVDLVSVSSRGRVWVADLGAAPAVLPAVPEERLPVISLTGMSMDEGDGPGDTTAQVPFKVIGEVKRPARFVVVTAGQESSEVQRFTVDLAPGQTSGTIPIRYTPDTRDDLDKIVTQITAWPLFGTMTDRYFGSLTILDDDPRPAITVRPVSRRVVEGQPARWRVSLAETVDYDLPLFMKVVRGPRPTVRVKDIDKAWISEQAGYLPPRKPLWKAGLMFYDQIRQGRLSTVISIPTRRDRIKERPESLTIKVKLPGFRAIRTVKVVDAKRRKR